MYLRYEVTVEFAAFPKSKRFFTRCGAQREFDKYLNTSYRVWMLGYLLWDGWVIVMARNINRRME